MSKSNHKKSYKKETRSSKKIARDSSEKKFHKKKEVSDKVIVFNIFAFDFILFACEKFFNFLIFVFVD